MIEAECWLLKQGSPPHEMRDDIFRPYNTKEWDIRFRFRARFGFAILTEEIIEVLRPYSPFLELGSGSGYWAYELRRAGVSVIATDPGIGHYGFGHRTPWTTILPFTASDAVRHYPDLSLLLVWPDYNNSWADEALSLTKGTQIVYVGEGEGGCTADEAFHKQLASEWINERVIALPVFYGLHDRLYIYKRKGA